ncbi:GMC oxidoreductase [Bradyrhizobium sp. UFLA05-153]
MTSVDVSVVGSGANGSIVAHEVARAGFRVLVLEAGHMLPIGASLSTVQNGRDDAVLVRSPAGTLMPFEQPWSVSAPGGGMTLYAGIAFRYRSDFDAEAHVAGDALDPIWPIDYADLRPDYEELELRMEVARLAGADSLEPPSDGAVLPPHGCRAGIDPKASAVDRWGRVHDIDNVYGTDRRFFPYPGGVNPTFTMQANALGLLTEPSRSWSDRPRPENR